MEKNAAKRIGVIACCVVLFGAAGVIVALTSGLTGGEEGEKKFTLTVLSERDGINRSEEYSSECKYFGQWCREQDFISYKESSYGIYITAVDGCAEDMGEQYWWCVTVNGESSLTGADEIALESGSVYGLELKKGWD